MRQNFLLSVCLLALISSCRYKYETWVTTDVEKVCIKYPKDPEKREECTDKRAVKYQYKVQDHNRYLGQIASDTIHGSTFIQFDTARVYLFCGTKYKSVFTSGLVSAQMIYCALDSNCIPHEDWKLFKKDGTRYIPDLWGWTGHTITIDYFEEVKYLEKTPQQRWFKFWVNTDKIRLNGSNYVFFLELTNNKATADTDMETFIKEARVTFIKKMWIMV